MEGNSLINENFILCDSIADLRKKYISLLKEISEFYEERINLFSCCPSIGTRIRLYEELSDIDERKQLLDNDDELKKCVLLSNKIDDLFRLGKDILVNGIDFRKFGKGFCNHQIVYVDGNLFCSCCNSSFNDYNLTKEELDFLRLCADNNGIFIKEVKSNGDLLLLKVLQQEWNECRSRRVDDLSDKDYFEKCEENSLIDESEVSEIRSEIINAYALDCRKESKISTIYLTEDEKKSLLEKIEKEEEIIRNSDFYNKDLLLWECSVSYYEVLLLSGKSIPDLWNGILEENKEFLVAAIYRLSTPLRRENTTYFKELKDAWNYNCRTAIPEINEKILKMKR